MKPSDRGFGKVGVMRLTILILSAMILAACASTQQPSQFTLAARQASPTLWPSYPEVPRFQYLGQLSGEANFVSEKREAGRGKRFLTWLAGLRDEAPDVVTLLRPQSGMVDVENQRILVTDVGLNAVMVFDEQAGELELWYQADQQQLFAAPIAIVKISPDEYLVSDAELGRLVRLSGQGQPLGSITSEKLLRPAGMVFDAVEDCIYVADTAADDIKIFSPQGLLMGVIGEPGEGIGQFNAPTHLSLRGRNLVVSDTFNSRVQMLTIDGENVRTIGERGLFVGNFVRPKGVASDSEGNIYVIESLFDHLLIYNDSGELLLSIGGTGSLVGQFYLPAGVWVDQQDRVFIADMLNGRVIVLQYLGST